MKRVRRIGLVVSVLAGSAGVPALLGIGPGLARVQAQTEYVIGAQDVLTVTVFGEAELSGRYIVDQDGTFTYPQLGRIKAGGLTLRGVEQDLKTKLADGYLRNPQVSVAIETYRSQRILIIGEVRAPGEYQLTGDMTLLAALAKAGSPLPSAGHQVLIFRAPKRTAAGAAPGSAPAPGAQGGEQPAEGDVLRISLADLQAGNVALNILLQDGDTINVPKAQQVFVSGQVRQPGAYSIERGTTLLQLLTLAGGITDRGSQGRIRLLRVVDGKQKEFGAKLTDIVEPGDTIVVKERFF